ncbi:unnamed protein product, partial [marine sediment metagenome]
VNQSFTLSTGFAKSPGKRGSVDFPGMSRPAEVATEIRRIAREVNKNKALSVNIPFRFGGGIGGGQGGDAGIIHWRLDPEGTK